MIRVAVLGALGNMGREVVRAVAEDPDLELAAAVDPVAPGRGKPFEVAVMRHVTYLEGLDIDVMVDFTEASAAVPNILWALEQGIHCVVGTTGISPDDLARIGRGEGDLGGCERLDRLQLRYRRRDNDEAGRSCGRSLRPVRDH